MKYECTIIFYKENKHINVSYNVKKNMKKYLFNEIRESKRSHFWLPTQETRNFKYWVQISKLSLKW